ncbi:MAG: hypothetical protein KAS32_18075 [Candidatus Peribacteraceae bacterium]|nr:hypothetical protein [Candidatus Peribacteraceae bacterium]
MVVKFSDYLKEAKISCISCSSNRAERVQGIYRGRARDYLFDAMKEFPEQEDVLRDTLSKCTGTFNNRCKQAIETYVQVHSRKEGRKT